MSPTHKQNKSMDRSVYFIRRTAIDRCGRVGSLYDGYRERVLDSLNDTHPEKSCRLRETRRCEIVLGSKDQNQNILQMVRIDDESRLSLILNLREKTGIGAIVDYSDPINEYTRLFCYTYTERVQKLSDDVKDTEQIISRITSKKKATHVITDVERGIDVVVVLQLPSISDTVLEIGRVLDRICTSLKHDGDISSLTADENRNLDKIIHTRVYSNTDEIKHMATLYDVCKYIEKNKNSTVDQPVSYNLRPITWFYPQYTADDAIFVPLTTEINRTVEQYVLQITTDMRKLAIFIKEDLPKRLSGHLREELFKVQKQCSDVKDKCTREVERFSKLVLGVRNGQIKISQIDEALKDNEPITIKNTIHNLAQIVHDLAEKGHFISDLDRRRFRYVNVAEQGIDRADTERAIERRLIGNGQYDRILCSNDFLNKNDPDQLRQLRYELVEELKNNSTIHLIYADFSYCSYELQYMMRLPLSIYNTENMKLKQKQSLSSKEIQHSATPSTKIQTIVSLLIKSQTRSTLFEGRENSGPQTAKVQTTSLFPNTQNSNLSQTKVPTYRIPPTETKILPPASTTVQTTNTLPTTTQSYILTQAKSQSPLSPITEVQTHVIAPIRPQSPQSRSAQLPADETINLLLLGETGVGKSTFINALANYLTFNTLQQGETGHPVVLIPVSFLITVGDNFDEYTVKFGDVDGLKNEDFSHPGQSVTQRCKSYDFRLHSNDKKILRIIDTPGFGDTRGLDQDDRNMAHILEYVKKLPHLNAICFLLKPNESRLNIFFRSCLSQLFSLLGQNIGHHIIFCFTNSRATFYTPGNTAPLLKQMLNSFPKNDIPFTKDNTFCFDSESFRYLVALQNQIKFNDSEREEYAMSWARSVTDANRLIRYIHTISPLIRY